MCCTMEEAMKRDKDPARIVFYSIIIGVIATIIAPITS